MRRLHALAGALLFPAGFAAGTLHACGASPRAPAPEARSAPRAELDPDAAQALEQLKRLQALRDLARANGLEETERRLLDLLVASLAASHDDEALGLLAGAGGGREPLPAKVASELLRACEEPHAAELRSRLLDFLAGRLERSAVLPVVVALAAHDRDASVRASAVRDLAALVDPGDSDVAVLVQATRDTDPGVRANAVAGLAPLTCREPVIDSLLDATAREADSSAKAFMIAALGALDDPRVQALLWKTVEGEQPLEVKLAALERLEPEGGDQARFAARLSGLAARARAHGDSVRLIEALSSKIVHPTDDTARGG